MDIRQLQRIKILTAIAKAKLSTKADLPLKRKHIDKNSTHIPTKRGLQEALVHYIKTNK